MVCRFAAVVFGVLSPLLLFAAQGQTSPGVTAKCIECHSKVTPNIVSDWKLSRHNQVDVGCDACHGDHHTSAPTWPK